MNAGGDDTPFQRARGARERRFFVASVPALPGCHTQAHSLDQLMARIQEAIALYLEVEGDSTSELDFVGVQRVAVEA